MINYDGFSILSYELLVFFIGDVEVERQALHVARLRSLPSGCAVWEEPVQPTRLTAITHYGARGFFLFHRAAMALSAEGDR